MRHFTPSFRIPEGRLCLAFDATYLTSTLSQMQLRGRRGMVGGMWYPDADAEVENAFVPLDSDNLDISKAQLFGNGKNIQQPV